LTGPGAGAGSGRCTLIAMPGVPSEMRRMFQNEVAPRLLSAMGGAAAGVLLHRWIHCFGMGESDLEAKLMDLTRRGRDPEVGITVHQATITLRVTARAPSPEACQKAMEPTVALIYERLGSYVFGEEEEQLEHAVAKLLTGRGATLATAEAVTGGLIALLLNSVPELAERYRGGLVPRSGELCRELLGMPVEMVDAVGISGPEAVEAMAVACRTRLGADLGLAVGERFLPDASDATPHVHVALATDAGTQVRRHNVGGDPAILQSRIAKIALNTVRLHLLAPEGSGSASR
jgi:nicotinamide-nucleotide amidase